MMSAPRYRSFLRTLYASILQSDFSATELRSLSEELRRGRLSDELAYMLDRVNEHFRDAPSSTADDDEINSAEQLMKSRKIPRVDLINILKSIDTNYDLSTAKDSSRVILRNFLAHANSNQWNKLLDILKAGGGSDAYLKGITDRRSAK